MPPCFAAKTGGGPTSQPYIAFRSQPALIAQLSAERLEPWLEKAGDPWLET